jgi:Protein of unknown function (DUF2955)
MSSDGITEVNAAPDVGNPAAQRAALRIGFGLALGFALAELSGAVFFFFPPFMAVQFLATMPQPPSLRQAIGLTVLTALISGFVLLLAGIFAGHPPVFLLLVGILIFFGFLLDTAGKAMPASLLLTFSATLPLLSTQSSETAGLLAFAFIEATVIGLLATWIMFALFPAPPADASTPPPPLGSADPRIAFANTLVLLPVLLLFLMQGNLTFVVLMVIIAIIRLRDRSGAPRAALGLLLGNVFGGIAATIVYAFLTLQSGIAFFLLLVAAVGLIFATRIVRGGVRAPMFTIALVTFVILLGLGVAPAPSDSGEAFTTRLWNVLLAGAYAVGATSLIAVRKPKLPEPTPAAADPAPVSP